MLIGTQNHRGSSAEKLSGLSAGSPAALDVRLACSPKAGAEEAEATKRLRWRIGRQGHRGNGRVVQLAVELREDTVKVSVNGLVSLVRGSNPRRAVRHLVPRGMIDRFYLSFRASALGCSPKKSSGETRKRRLNFSI
jgi:hypothetical protein